jgi:hypothetical protein
MPKRRPPVLQIVPAAEVPPIGDNAGPPLDREPANPLDGELRLPTKRAFAILHVGKTKGFALIKAGVLKTVLVGRTRLVTIESLRQVLRDGVPSERFVVPRKSKPPVEEAGPGAERRTTPKARE